MVDTISYGTGVGKDFMGTYDSSTLMCTNFILYDIVYICELLFDVHVCNNVYGQ